MHHGLAQIDRVFRHQQPAAVCRRLSDGDLRRRRVGRHDAFVVVGIAQHMDELLLLLLLMLTACGDDASDGWQKHLATGVSKSPKSKTLEKALK